MSTLPDPALYEKLGTFYLGREFDLAHGALRDDLVLYDAKDLTTHALCVGMTGSGKTGLCVSLLEEAAIDGIPALVIDPKGDLSNLLLTFPALSAADFRPWVNPDDAVRRGQSVDELARAEAQLWRKGLADWGQDGGRIQRLRDQVELRVFTPGSESGRPLSVLASFDAPEAAVLEDADAFRDQVNTTATSLLAIVGVDGDPLQSREHILLTNIIDRAWREGRSLDLPGLIAQIQKPPMARIGVLDLESFYPSKERFELALRLNNLLAAPGFEAWTRGEPLDIQSLLYTPEGRPRISVLHIAHLPERERMFVVTLVLNRLTGWLRNRTGTTSLRALLYMDEIFGYMPPVAEPPSKRPLLRLLKQARAYGLGVVLATQNPVDLDYKGLSNIGTWFLGRLQTERDKKRVLDGLEGASVGAKEAFDRAEIERTLSGLGKRVFMMHNVHEDGPVVFQTRWALSYLRGPLTRREIARLDPWEPEAGTRADTIDAAPNGPGAPTSAASGPTPPPAPQATQALPVLPPSIAQVHLPVQRWTGSSLVYRARIAAVARVRYADARRGVEAEEEIGLLAPIPGPGAALDWSAAVATETQALDFLERPPAPGRYDDVPAEAARARNYATWKRQLKDHLYAVRTFDFYRSPVLGEYSKDGESESDFRLRLGDQAREERDRAVESLRKRYATKFQASRDRIRRYELAVQREQEQARGASLQTAISFGATLMSALLGRKAISATTLGKATTAARGAGRAMDQAGDVGRARSDVETERARLAELEAEFDREVAETSAGLDPSRLELETVSIRPRKSALQILAFALAWVPFDDLSGGGPVV